MHPLMQTSMLPQAPRPREALPPVQVAPSSVTHRVDEYLSPAVRSSGGGNRVLLGTDGEPLGKTDLDMTTLEANIPKPTIQPHPDWRDEMQKALEAEANSTYIGAEPPEPNKDVQTERPAPEVQASET